MAVAAFRHEALLYAGDAEFVEGTARFIRDGVERREPTLVVVSAAKIDMLRDELGADAAGVHFADMAGVGANPARIIPAWREFVQAHDATGSGLRGIGEPIWKGRDADELVECQRHESLLNVAFAGGRPWWLLCPYDTAQLDPEVVAEARRSHPFVLDGSGHAASTTYRGLKAETRPWAVPLPEPAREPAVLAFDADSLGLLRRMAAREAARSGLTGQRAADLVMAVNELATNSLRHGGGSGQARIWEQPGALVCEVRDRGRLTAPLADRERPPAGVEGGRGLWLVNQLCDLLQLRVVTDGTIARLHMRLA
jgi:anti-sigma regulatory factor (Ser/Thr protein kinase)